MKFFGWVEVVICNCLCIGVLVYCIGIWWIYFGIWFKDCWLGCLVDLRNGRRVWLNYNYCDVWLLCIGINCWWDIDYWFVYKVVGEGVVWGMVFVGCMVVGNVYVVND